MGDWVLEYRFRTDLRKTSPFADWKVDTHKSKRSTLEGAVQRLVNLLASSPVQSIALDWKNQVLDLRIRNLATGEIIIPEALGL